MGLRVDAQGGAITFADGRMDGLRLEIHKTISALLVRVRHYRTLVVFTFITRECKYIYGYFMFESPFRTDPMYGGSAVQINE